MKKSSSDCGSNRERTSPAKPTLPAGKLPAHLLRCFLDIVPNDDPTVVVGGAIGEDAAVIDVGGRDLLVAKTDPITFTTADIGRYLLAVNTNDLATMGAEPRWLMVTALLAEKSTAGDAGDVLGSVRSACLKYDVALVGGHTEITVGLDRPIVVGTLFGTVPRGRLIRTSGAQVGDAVLLAGGIAIEGTAILASEHASRLTKAGVTQTVIRRAAKWIHTPGISVLPAARILRTMATIHAMHDPTEGGLATALQEIAEAAHVGVRLDLKPIPVLHDTRVICDALGLNPLGLLASGALLATLDPAEAPLAKALLADNGIKSALIGEIVPAGKGTELPAFERDELARFLSENSPAG